MMALGADTANPQPPPHKTATARQPMHTDTCGHLHMLQVQSKGQDSMRCTLMHTRPAEEADGRIRATMHAPHA